MTREFMAQMREGRRLFGYYEGVPAARSAINKVADAAVGVWVGLNPISADSILLATLNEPLHQSAHRAAAADIARRRTLLFDFDAQLADGCSGDEMSNDLEHDAAMAQAAQCASWLVSLGWQRPKAINSGRGAQLHSAVDLSTDAATTALIRNLLLALKSRYPLLDPGMFDLPRLARLPGQWNRKSDAPTPERPWRMATVLDEGDAGLVTQAQIEAVIATIGLAPPVQHSGPETPDPEKVQRVIERLASYLDRIGIALQEIVPLSDGRTLLRLDRCPLYPELHFGSSTGIGLSVSGRPLRMCQHSNSCGAMGWAEWRRAVEKRTGVQMPLGGTLIFSKAKGGNQ
jgi:hypothetical protein